MSDMNDRIERRAHEIWEREGKPHGKHDEHWAQAEAEIRAEDEAEKKDKPAAKDPAAKGKASAKPQATSKDDDGKGGTRAAAENLSAVAAGRSEQTGTTKTGGQISRGGASRGKTAKAAKKDATP